MKTHERPQGKEIVLNLKKSKPNSVFYMTHFITYTEVSRHSHHNKLSNFSQIQTFLNYLAKC